MNIKVLLVFLIGIVFLQCSDSAKILGVFPLAGKSLNILYNKIMVTLANAGHNVTLISCYEPKDKITNGSLKHIGLPGFIEEYYERMKLFDPWYETEHSDPLESKFLLDLVVEDWKKFFKFPEVKELTNSNEHFDAVIVEDIWMDCFKVYSAIFKCPLIVFSSFGGNNPFSNAALGNPLLPSYAVHFFTKGPYFYGMTFFQRMKNFYIFVSDTLVKYFYLYPKYNEILRSGIDNPPDISSFYNNISLVLLGSHSSLRQAAPQAPNVVEIGGFHIDPPKKLPKNIQDFLDGATDGAIYFSLGTHIDSADMPKEMVKMFLKTFGKMKQRVLWKFETDLPERPANVFIDKWLPQPEILAHPNMKVFITHGGHGSYMETVYHGVPCLMVPLFFDQYNNAYHAAQSGIAIKLNLVNMNEENLEKALKELLENPKYREVAKEKQRLFHDRPMHPKEALVYWVNYVINHKGADHLKMVAMNLPWYQLYCVDIILFLLVSAVVVLLLVHLAIKKVLTSVFRSGKTVEMKKKQ